MTDRDKQRLDELELKTAYILARQNEQDAKLNQIIARLVYIETRQYRIMKELGIDSEKIDSIQTASDDAKALTGFVSTSHRLN